MQNERRVRLFRNGQNQAVRIPKDFELDGKEATVQKVNDCLILEPVKKKGLLSVLAELETLEEEFPDVDARLGVLDAVKI